ncbi:hypothetical protein [Sedimenticola hydrogenitrophicus]|uniref:hypothetical protein n=1 Tax=Sedimenticola hydrogenitrophicus TaxID=2967975 RepID=UPI0023AEAC64|nr:hypothetical protein [Sedimenticola hydrogenitrophicus]
MKRSVVPLLLCVATLGLITGSNGHAETATCHLHVPDDFPKFSNQPLVFPAVGDPSQCASSLSGLTDRSEGKPI